MRIAVLIPCYNEAATIGKVVTDYRKLLPEAAIYVYDNRSTDDSATRARAAGAIVVPEHRQGKGFVIRSMFRDIDADVYLMVDGDDTYEAESAVALVQPVIDGRADMVIGDRLSSSYFEENSRPLHGPGNRLVRWLINRLFRADISDVMTGARCFSRLFVKSYPVMSPGFEIETEMTIHALDKQFNIVEMPVGYRDRAVGSLSKLKTVPDGLRVLKTILALFKDFRPLLFSGSAAALLFVIALGLFIPPLEEYLATRFVYKIPSLVVAAGFGTGSLLTLVAGVVLDSLRKQSRMFYELHVMSVRSSDEQPHSRKA